jgi:hypothetical protein
MGDAELLRAEGGAPTDAAEAQAIKSPDLSLRTWFSYFGRSPRVKWYLPMGLFGLVRMIMQMGVVVTLLIVVGIFAVAMPLGYFLWRARGGGPDPGY